MILKTGWSQDPQQRMIQQLMLYGIPFSLLVSGWNFPIGVIIYWVTQNLFSLGQQYWVLHEVPAAAHPGPDGRQGDPAKAPAKPTGRPRSSRRGPVRPPAPAPPQTSRPSRRARRAWQGHGAEPAAEPASQSRALAPKPGAKPVNPKKNRPAKRR